MGGSCDAVKAFTLAEVLIVLGIIGLIADMTIPTLVSKTQEKVAVVRLKKAHATFENAFRLAVSANGTPENWDLGGDHNLQGAKNILNNLAPYLILTKNCEEKGGCYPNVYYKHLNGGSYVNYYPVSDRYVTAQLNDGTLMVINTYNKDCDRVAGETPALQSACGGMSIDINGLNGPNQHGVDSFPFYITKSGIIPMGSKAQTGGSFDVGCRDKSTATGWGCTAWVIYNENMDYLHCGDLSWDGKKTCK